MTRLDSIQWRSTSLLHKYSPDQVSWAVGKYGFEPGGSLLATLFSNPEDGIHEDPTSNLVTTVGLARITNLITGGGGVAMSHANAACGVGDTATAAAIGDTQLGSNSASHSRYIPADTSYPTVSNGVISMQNTFGSSDANFAWAEWGWVVATTTTASDTFAGSGTSPTLFNHKIASLGTKVSGASWVFNTTVTLS